jgi:hypothetical protein
MCNELQETIGISYALYANDPISSRISKKYVELADNKKK